MHYMGPQSFAKSKLFDEARLLLVRCMRAVAGQSLLDFH